ncbi:MAG: DNA polymerase III subunit delta' [Candidatus Omnitrophica bacterium]|nr:DNA polymerase III subunit delta' [Candidatus Omnitrophota bacterium]
MSLNKFLGNQLLLKRIREALVCGQLGHSLLVTGAKGLGKKTFARFLAKAIECHEGVFFEPCHCVSCSKIDSGNHPDVKWYGIDEEKTSVKLAEIKDLIHWIGLKPFEGKKKVFIINDAQDMTLESQNALLKTLEEPPVESVILLLAPHKNALLETIVSRLTELKLRPLPFKEIVQVLRDDLGTEKDWAALAQAAEGNLGKAIQFAEEGKLEEQKDRLSRWLGLGSWDFFAQETIKSRQDVSERVDLILHFLRDALIYKELEKKEMLFFPHELLRIREFAGENNSEEIVDLMKELMSIRESLENNINQKIASNFLASILNACHP